MIGQKKRIPLKDSLDGKFDMSDYIIEANGFVPVPLIIKGNSTQFTVSTGLHVNCNHYHRQPDQYSFIQAAVYMKRFKAK